MSKPEFLRGKGEAKIPLQAGGSGLISVDYFEKSRDTPQSFSGDQVWWPIFVGPGEILICHAMVQPDDADFQIDFIFDGGSADVGNVAQPFFAPHDGTRWYFWGVIGNADNEMAPAPEGWHTIGFNCYPSSMSEGLLLVEHVTASVAAFTFFQDSITWSAGLSVSTTFGPVTINPGDGSWWFTTAGGVTGGSEPTWSGHAVGDTVTDGTVVWQRISGSTP